MKQFTENNTHPFDEEELDKLNDEWVKLINELDLEEFTDKYYEQAKIFIDKVARRM